ncbi:hypothetical protein GDO81_006795 [Engystomops pustulosus]|uniref:Uncharacterized protein n=1 Tax=Engystomops pustulosus TaxID=76066 RepID=A0AAV7CZG7_ENGPU|nr:hypothetical protein GDO81_006795 [Engystomops pustulosus]
MSPAASSGSSCAASVLVPEIRQTEELRFLSPDLGPGSVPNPLFRLQRLRNLYTVTCRPSLLQLRFCLKELNESRIASGGELAEMAGKSSPGNGLRCL